jgi:hypothetical protein
MSMDEKMVVEELKKYRTEIDQLKAKLVEMDHDSGLQHMVHVIPIPYDPIDRLHVGQHINTGDYLKLVAQKSNLQALELRAISEISLKNAEMAENIGKILLKK